MTGWLVNDLLGTLLGSTTFWSRLLEWLPGLQDKTGTPFEHLAPTIERMAVEEGEPDYLIRNGTFFPILGIECPQITLIQDIAYSAGRQWQVQIARRAACTVFNSQWTKEQYHELDDVKSVVIPIGVDFEHFRPVDSDPARFGLPVGQPIVAFVGAASAIKGFQQLVEIIEATPWHYALILKDDARFNAPRVTTFNKVTHQDLVGILNCCRVGVCTSVRETQHLAGIEMGACNLPMVTTDIGIYYNQPTGPGTWGVTGEIEEFPELLADVIANYNHYAPRRFWEAAGVTLPDCRSAWRRLVDDTCRP